jgi:hypothetical protein
MKIIFIYVSVGIPNSSLEPEATLRALKFNREFCFIISAPAKSQVIATAPGFMQWSINSPET